MKFRINQYLSGALTICIGMFLASLWSPDYYDFVSKGYNFLLLGGFLLVLILLQYLFPVRTSKHRGSKK